MNTRHTEWFGPDLGRGPFAAHLIETAALQVATALAQLRAPLTRSDDDVRSHADFIRELADRLAPDWAALLKLDVGDEAVDTITTTITAATGTCSLLHCWLADSFGGGVTPSAPDLVTFRSGTILQTLLAGREYLVIAPPGGVVLVDVAYSGIRTWRWAVCRTGRVYYSAELDFV